MSHDSDVERLERALHNGDKGAGERLLELAVRRNNRADYIRIATRLDALGNTTPIDVSSVRNVHRTWMLGHEDSDVLRCAPDGLVLAVAGTDRISLVEVSTWSVQKVLRFRSRPVQMRFSRDSTTLDVLGEDHVLRVFDVHRSSDAQVASCVALVSRGGQSFARSPEGRWLVTHTEPHALVVWDARAGYSAHVRLSVLGEGDWTCLAWSPDGLTLAWTRCGGGWASSELRIWRFEAGELQEIQHVTHEQGFYANNAQLVFTPDNRHLVSHARDAASAGRNNPLTQFWPVLKGAEPIAHELIWGWDRVHISADSQRFYGVGNWRDISSLALPSGATRLDRTKFPLPSRGLYGEVYELRELEADVWAALAMDGVGFFDMRGSRNEPETTSYRFDPEPLSAALLPATAGRGVSVVCLGVSGRLTLHEVDREGHGVVKKAAHVRVCVPKAEYVRVASGASLLALTSAGDRATELWCLRRRQQLIRWTPASDWTLSDAMGEGGSKELENMHQNVKPKLTALSPDGQTFAVLHYQMILSVRDSALGTQLWSCWCNPELALVEISEEDMIALVAYNGIEIRSLRTGELRHRFETRNSLLEVNSMAFSPDGRWLAYTLNDGLVLWDIEGEAELASRPEQPVCLAFHPRQQRLAMGFEGRELLQIECWEFDETGRLEPLWQHHEPIRSWQPHASVDALAFSPEGDVLAASWYLEGPARRSVGLFDSSSGQRLAEHGATAWGLAFTHTGRLVSSALNGIQVWEPLSHSI